MAFMTDQERIDREIDRALDRLPLTGPLGSAAGSDLLVQLRAATRGGKRIRPRLVLDSFRAFAAADAAAADAARVEGDEAARVRAEADVVPDVVWSVAAGYELLHAAFVVHDDIIDQDTHRRGQLNVRGALAQSARVADPAEAARIGDAGALLVGDLLLYAATRTILMAETGSAARQRLALQLDEALAVSAAGEWADAARTDGEKTAALETAAAKTAIYTFAAPLRSGATLAGADDSSDQRLEALARHLGIAFQLADDLIGAFGTWRQAGRDAGADLREGKRTPLVAIARETSAWPTVSTALALAPTGPVAIAHAQRELERSGAREQAAELLRDHLGRARMIADTLPSGIVVLIDEVAAEIESRIP